MNKALSIMIVIALYTYVISISYIAVTQIKSLPLLYILYTSIIIPQMIGMTILRNINLIDPNKDRIERFIYHVPLFLIGIWTFITICMIGLVISEIFTIIK